MDKNNIIDTLSIDPVVRYANYHESPKGIGWMSRVIPDPQLILCIKGVLRFAYEDGQKDDKPIDIKAGNILFIEAGRLHSVYVVENCLMSTFHFEFVPEKTWIALDYRVNPAPETLLDLGDELEKFHIYFLNLSKIFQDYKRYRRERLNSLSRLILLEVLHYWNQPSSHPASKRMQEIVSYIRQHLHEDIDRNIISRLFFVTPEHINLIFKQELHCTPTDFINRERCILAGRLLDEGLTVKEASFKVGFEDPGYFCRVFKKHMKVKPIQMKR